MLDASHTPGPRTPGPTQPGQRVPGTGDAIGDVVEVLAIGDTDTVTAGSMTVTGIDLDQWHETERSVLEERQELKQALSEVSL